MVKERNGFFAALCRALRGTARTGPSDPFVGRVAIITLGTASRAHGAQAEVLDAPSGERFVTVVPKDNAMRFAKGERVELVGRENGRYVAVPARTA